MTIQETEFDRLWRELDRAKEHIRDLERRVVGRMPPVVTPLAQPLPCAAAEPCGCEEAVAFRKELDEAREDLARAREIGRVLERRAEDAEEALRTSDAALQTLCERVKVR